MVNRMTSKNGNLHSAKTDKKDEFYTRLEDIENELRHYKHHFKGKTVYCNCDDPRVSNFFKYFSLNFKHLGLKKLISSCYRNTDPDMRTDGVSDKAVWLEYTGEHDEGTIPTAANIGVHEFDGDGDFRSDESIALLEQADIVVTNPPFSLFREYVGQLIEYDKRFVIVGSVNAITYKEIFPLLKDNMMWLGYGFKGGNAYFQTPHEKEFAKNVFNVETGLVKFRNVTWYTNLDISKRHESLILYKEYISGDYPMYDNYDAINIDKTKDIPSDYDGIMGVPITFLDKYNPEQFEIIDINPHFFIMQEQGLPKLKQLSLRKVGRKDPYARILIKHKKAVTTNP